MGLAQAASKLSDASSDHFAIERVNLLHHRFVLCGRVEVVGKVTRNQILRHVVSYKFNGISRASRPPSLSRRTAKPEFYIVRKIFSSDLRTIFIEVVVQFKNTPKALANFSPGLELATTLGSEDNKRHNPERVRQPSNPV